MRPTHSLERLIDRILLCRGVCGGYYVAIPVSVYNSLHFYSAIPESLLAIFSSGLIGIMILLVYW
jgi:hypothetical protein